MNSITIDDLIKLVGCYIPENEIIKIKKAYELAYSLHDGQKRQSGEPYIIHPLAVAYILAEKSADSDTICAGLLHDTIEDTGIEKEEIERLFNREIANLVDGVTKIRALNFIDKKTENLANTRKIITSLQDDVRIIMIKLADRLHNMRTLGFKRRDKQIENSLETLKIFVPLARYIGDYQIKIELEDLALQYVLPEKYKKIEEQRQKVIKNSKKCIDEMNENYEDMLNRRNIEHNIDVRIKNIYSIYEKLEKGYKIKDIHDLISFKIKVDNIDNCYLTLRDIHSQYKPVNNMFKDYICNPKTNMYMSLHTTVFGADNKIVQNQIRTFDMDKIASCGLTAYWDISGENARNSMQEDLRNKYQFYSSLVEIDKTFGNNQEFVNQIKEELFADRVYVYSPKGDVFEFPKGSTVIDFGYRIHTDIGNNLVGAYINENFKDVHYVLQNNDRVFAITNPNLGGPKDNWLDYAYTTRAKCKIKEFNKKINN